MKSVRFAIFLAAAVVIGLGFIGVRVLEKDPGMAFLLGSLTLGGGILISGLFSLKMPWHGIIAAGILALLGFGRGILNAPGFAEYLGGSRERGIAPVLEAAVAAICMFLLLAVHRTWSRERLRRVIEGE
jgi:hypothetical protein